METLRTLFYGSAVYHLALWQPASRAPSLRLGVPWPGRKERGAALMDGDFTFAGETVKAGTPPWDADRSDAWRAALHGFGWLADLAALDSEPAARRAQEWTNDWVQRFDIYDRLAWRADVIGDRLFAWLEHFDFVTVGEGSSADRRGLVASFGRQARHLARVAGHEGTGLTRLTALAHLVAVMAALGRRRTLERALDRLARAVEAQILPDGGHRARNPAAQLIAVRVLVDARAALAAIDEPVPLWLAAAIERAAPMLRSFRHGDGRFALFNGSNEGEPAMIDLVLARASAKGRPPQSAPQTGFERLQAGGTIVLIDCGDVATPGYDETAHAGLLAFEMSHGRERIIVNCGAYDGPSAEWRAAMRATAAHSTVIVADTNAAEIRPDGSIGTRPATVLHRRAEDDGNLLVAASHDGYRGFGLNVARHLALSADGDDLEGEDRLSGTAGSAFAIRFHLHPRVDPAAQPDGQSVLLRLSSGGAWRLKAEGAVLSLAESLYVGEGTRTKTRQVVLDGHVGSGGATVRWSIRRE